MFEPVAVERIADSVVEQIETLILSGVLQPGRKLPPERDLSEMLNVSRPKLREAIHALESRGLVEIRRSEGAFVRPLVGAALDPAMVALYARHAGSVSDILEFRREQEGFAARLAASRATAEERAGLGAMLGAMEAAERDGNDAQEVVLDREFHIAVVEAAHNSMLLHVMRALYGLMEQVEFCNRVALYRRPGTARDLLEQHRAIVEAITGQSPDAAARASEAHVDYVIRALRETEDDHRRQGVARKRLGRGDVSHALQNRRR
jgi:GntR family transcriptional repressor for pyruvate dehydrogenase complex